MEHCERIDNYIDAESMQTETLRLTDNDSGPDEKGNWYHQTTHHRDHLFQVHCSCGCHRGHQRRCPRFGYGSDRSEVGCTGRHQELDLNASSRSPQLQPWNARLSQLSSGLHVPKIPDEMSGRKGGARHIANGASGEGSLVLRRL